MTGTYIVEAVLAVLILACFIPIIREEWAGRGVLRFGNDEEVD